MAKVRTRRRGKTWSYAFEAGKTLDGKRKAVEKGGFTTRQEAYEAGTAAFADWKRGNKSITSEKVTLTVFAENWLDNVAAMNLRPGSLNQYRSMVKNHILPHLGKTAVQKITPALLDQWMRGLAREGYSHGTLVIIHSILRQILSYAVYPCEIITSNPCLYIKVPRSAPRNVVKRTIIAPEQFASMLKDYPVGMPFRMVLLLLYHTGMRVSEVCGLEWQDIDLEHKAIHVKKQLRRIGAKSLCLMPPKTASSVRTIYIDSKLVSELRTWRKKQAQNELQAGVSYIYLYRHADKTVHHASKAFDTQASAKHLCFVCTKENGMPYEQSGISGTLSRYHCNSHSFRHTHATLLAEAGVSAKDIASRLGHSNTQTTENLYMHETEAMARQASDTFADFLRQKMQTNP